MPAMTLIPTISGPYKQIYRPEPDIYQGIPSPSFTPGTRYEDWIVNDFSILSDTCGTWHAIGITHPRPPQFIDAFRTGDNTHEAENQLFHAVFHGTLRQLYESGTMLEQPKLLYPQERPGQPPECWAPAVFPFGDGYGMLYSPQYMQLCYSNDFYKWEWQRTLFEGCPMMRDPFVLQENGTFYIVYNDNETLWLRETTDFIHISEPRIFQPNVFGNHVFMESPSIYKLNDLYYLLWSACDGTNSQYDNRTYVYCSPTLDGFSKQLPVAMLKGHAPELVCDTDGQWYIVSVFYPQNGLSMAPIRWEALYDQP